MRAAFARRIGPTDRRKLISAIHAQAHALRLDDDARRDLQRNLVGVESSKDMSLVQLSTVWQRLTVLAQDAGLARPRLRKRPGRDERLPDDIVTEEQTEKIMALFDALGVAAVGQARMHFSRRVCGCTWPQTREQANKVIEALKAMQARGWKPKGDERNAEGAQEKPGIVEPPPCSPPAHDGNVLGQCAQVEAGSTLPAGNGEKK